MEVGFQRRKGGGACNEKSTKRRNYIGSGSARPTVEDDAEFVGLWAYGQLSNFFIQGRKNAIAYLFEALMYLFVPWEYTVEDKVIRVDTQHPIADGAIYYFCHFRWSSRSPKVGILYY